MQHPGASAQRIDRPAPFRRAEREDIALGQTALAGDDPHAVGSERPELARRALGRHGLDKGVAGDQEIADHGLDEFRARHAWVRPRQQVEQGVPREHAGRLSALAGQGPGHRRGCARHLIDRAKGNDVLSVAFRGESVEAARTPHRAPGLLQRDETAARGGLSFARADERPPGGADVHATGSAGAACPARPAASVRSAPRPAHPRGPD